MSIEMQETLLKAYDPPKPWTERWFSPITHGSLRMTILFLVTTATGAGFLAMPLTMQTSGITAGLLMMSYAIWAAYENIIMTGRCFLVLGHSHLSEIVDYVGGSRLQRIVLGFMSLAACMNIVLHNVLLVQISAFFLQIIGIIDELPDYNNPFSTFRICAILLLAGIQGVIFIKTPSPEKMKIYSFLSLASVIYTIIVLVAEFPAYLRAYWSWDEVKLGIHLSQETIRDVGVYQFSFIMSANIIIGIYNLRNPIERRISKVAKRSSVVLAFLYLPVAIIGYLSTLSNTPSVIVNRDPLEGMATWPMQIARCGLAFTLLTANITCYASLRSVLTQFLLIGKESKSNIDKNASSLLQDILTIIGITVVGLFLSQIITTMSFVGGTTGTIIFCLPLLVALRAPEFQLSKLKKVELRILLVITICFGIHNVFFDLGVYFGLIQE
mmetsp:Transcript_61875/g.70975  ORF Transcript_61875/g.70975 Transcript_61875/m.70975 type:complete len:440 (+) Transcript_61875:437-1756(+)|eukprot:CAMPEP_0115012522 /NCGR_PEP_ID=MMETSP0216-20121206/24794_1 /TAXON_ID=223996 /ORGANISM="Protocruzia adherens, Strain Boccale" /LENGTH=439 /DNA_ID=CAMNT_0002381609 /DNA_START=422 /DNA_END=1741 /DNA_ORIENTATION=+